LVLEFIRGEILEKVGAGRPLSEEDVRKMARQLLEAVDYIHSLNVIHRDINPKNVFMSDPLKLIDFGTAKFFYSQAAKPEAVVSPGGYTPPEQYHYASSPQGDLWSVGATVFYACTGQPPLLALGDYPRAPVPADPRKFNRGISEPVRQLVLKATQADPTKRFSTAGEMLALLGKRKTAEMPATRLIIKNEPIPLESSSVVLGRMERYEKTNKDGKDMRSNPDSLIATQDKCEVVQEGDSYLIKIPDPLCYISRKHAEVFTGSDGWYVRDLGSLNKTAVYSNGYWTEVWKNHGAPSEAFPLHGGEWISLAYQAALGPYITALFKVD
jgi:serine/threonine protein kinase